MVRGYYFLLGGVFLLACVMAIPDIATALLMVTLGLAFPIVFAASLFAYGLCLLPAVLMWRDAGHRFAGGALSLFLIGALAYSPGVSGRRQAEEFARTQQADDRLPSAPVTAASIEIRRPLAQYDKTFLDNEACGKECRAAALYNGLKWVRVVMRSRQRRGDQSTSTFYSVERGDKCAGLAPAAPDAACVVIAPDTGDSPDLTLDLTVEELRGARGAFQLMRARTIKRMVARRASAPQVTLRQTEVIFDVAATPAMFAPRFRGINSAGVEIVAHEWRANGISLQDTLSKLGFSMTPKNGAPAMEQKPTDWRSGVNETLTRELVAVLDLSQKEPFNAQQAQVVSNWVMHARMERDWTPGMIALLRRIARDDRLRVPTFFDQIFERQPVVTTALMPDILEILERQEATRAYTLASSAAYTFPRIEPALLKPHAAKIVALIGKRPDLRDVLLPAVGRLGVDPTPYLLPLDANAKDYERKLRGACYAEAQWAPNLIGPLKEKLTAATSKRDRPQILVAALVRLGERDFVARTLDAQDRDDARLLRRIDSLNARRNAADAICAML